jgi:predicted RNA binding protein YcfA (HicA-like mRNA interferase family)
MKAREVIKRLEADGWYRIRSKSGHRQFKHAVKTGRVTVSGQANVDVPIKTLRVSGNRRSYRRWIDALCHCHRKRSHKLRCVCP